MKIGLLISGGLGLASLKEVSTNNNPVFVLTNKNSVEITEYCRKFNIPFFIDNPRNGATKKFLEDKHVDLILSINYLFLIEEDIINFPSSYCINIHGSLLPKYRGRTPHVWSIINNETYTGVTAHIINENCDTGPIVKQEKIKITEFDTGATLLGKFSPVYMRMISELLYEAEEGLIVAKEQDETKATYFNKRTPDDGKINWSWHKERIRNWIRAQAYPYPGAFSVVNNQRVIIDEIMYTEMGFNQDIPNGKVINTNPVLVKTANGVVELTKIRKGRELIQKGILL